MDFKEREKKFKEIEKLHKGIIKDLKQLEFKVKQTYSSHDYHYYTIIKNGKSADLQFHLDRFSGSYILIGERGEHKHIKELYYLDKEDNKKSKEELVDCIIEVFNKVDTCEKYYISDFTKEEINTFIKNLDLKQIYDFIKKELQIDYSNVPFEFKFKDGYSSNCYYTLICDNKNYKDKIHCGTLFNMALRSISLLVELYINSQKDENELGCRVSVDIRYTHIGGGSNGCDMFSAYTRNCGKTWEINIRE